MKTVILAGGFGSRIGEESQIKPKPMIEIGGKPLLWHIMKIYSAYGLNDFIVCLGYRGYQIKEYFANYLLHRSDVTFDIRNNEVEFHNKPTESWRVTLVETGDTTMTGGRLKRVANYLDEEDFCLTYGDGVGDIDILALIDFHRRKQTLATVTVVQPPGRFGSATLDGDRIASFTEKPQNGEAWVSAGFFVLSPKVIDMIEGDQTIWERAPMEGLAEDGELSAYKHRGFWQPMDTPRDKQRLEDLWLTGKAPWVVG